MKQHTNMKLALFSLAIQGLIQNLNLGNNMNVSICWRIEKKKKKKTLQAEADRSFCVLFYV